MSSLRIIVTGLIAQHPHMGGVAWDYVQYAAGLLRMGHDVYYFEDSGEWPYKLDGGPSGDDWEAKTPDENLKHLCATLSRFNLGDRWAYRFPRDNSWHGLTEAKRLEVLNTADLLINVSGTLEHPEQYRSVKRLAYIDSDPLFTQVKWLQKESELRSRVDLHDIHFSFGESLSQTIPSTGHNWVPTRQPMLLDEWATQTPPTRTAFTTVMNWTSYPPVQHAGLSYGQKDVEFKKFLSLPSAVKPAILEIALANTEHLTWQTLEESMPDEARRITREMPNISPRDLLRETGWKVVNPEQLCADLDSYRSYISSSKGEWSVAKNGYVQGRPGWFSCRSCCYLAASRPVVVQDTGFDKIIPTGLGVLTFTDFNEAVEAIHQVEAHYTKHATAALEIAKAYFDSSKVLSLLVNQAMNPTQLDSANSRPTRAHAT